MTNMNMNMNMNMNVNLSTFYCSPQWLTFRQIVIGKRLNDKGMSVCEHCGKPIIKSYDLILHHIEELTESNVNDCEIALNEDNIMIVHHRCHNKIHDRLGMSRDSKKIYLVYGPPLSGKSTWVKDNMNDGDLIVNIDDIWQCVSGCERYIKPNRLKGIVFGIRDYLIDSVRIRRGNWLNAYIIGGYPLISERQRLCRSLGAEEIFISCSKEQSIERLNNINKNNMNVNDYVTFIDEWWERYKGPL